MLSHLTGKASSQLVGKVVDRMRKPVHHSLSSTYGNLPMNLYRTSQLYSGMSAEGILLATPNAPRHFPLHDGSDALE